MRKAYRPIPADIVRNIQHHHRKKIEGLKINAPVIVSTVVSLITIAGLFYIIVLGLNSPEKFNQIILF